jgi:TonB family protein
LSYVLLRRNKFSEALSAAQTALRIEPAIANAHYVVGVVRLNAGDYDEALAAANETIRLNKNLAAAYLVKSEALWGLYVGPIDNSPREQTLFPPRPAPTPKPLTDEQKKDRRRKLKENEALLRQSAESLETYLKLNPAEPSADRWREQLATLKAISNLGEEGPDAVKYGVDVTTKARVLAKPEPQYTEEARQAGIRGRVVLRAIFGSDGRVRNILILKGLPMGLSWQAIEAARRIRFTPATIDGKPVSMFVQLEYFFNLY